MSLRQLQFINSGLAEAVLKSGDSVRKVLIRRSVQSGQSLPVVGGTNVIDSQRVPASVVAAANLFLAVESQTVSDSTKMLRIESISSECARAEIMDAGGDVRVLNFQLDAVENSRLLKSVEMAELATLGTRLPLRMISAALFAFFDAVISGLPAAE